MSIAQVIDKLALRSIHGRQWHVQSCSAVSGQGLQSGLDWISKSLSQPSQVASMPSRLHNFLLSSSIAIILTSAGLVLFGAMRHVRWRWDMLSGLDLNNLAVYRRLDLPSTSSTVTSSASPE